MFTRALFCVLLASASLVSGGEIEVSPTIASNLRNLAAYRVENGRISVDTGHFAGGLTMTGPRPSISERLVIKALDGDARIEYVQSSWREQVSLRLARRKATNAWDVELLRRPRGNSRTSTVRFAQPADEPLQLRVQDQVYRGDSLWSLWLANAEVCERELLPLLQLLRPDWPLDREVGELARLQTQLSSAQDSRQQEIWQVLVNNLAHQRQAVREQAYRELSAARPAVLVFLRRLSLNDLDAEQRYHVRQLLEVTAVAEDTPLSAAIKLFEAE